MAKQPEGKLQTVSTGEKLDGKKHYDNWAETYDNDLLIEYGYNAHIQAAIALENIQPDTSVKILDLGCGTGLLGKALHDKRYSNIDGVDFSEKMLGKAKQLNLYQNLFCMDLTQKTTLPQAEYDVAICAGIFGSGHLSANHTRELIRVVKSGGYLINLMNAMPYEDENFANFYNKFSEEGLWQILSNTTVNYMDELERPGRLIVARIHS